MNTQQGTLLGAPLAVMMPYVNSMIALIGLILFAIIKDGVTTDAIMNVLEGVAIAGVAAGGAVGIVHVVKQPGALVPAVPAPPVTSTPPAGVSGTMTTTQP